MVFVSVSSILSAGNLISDGELSFIMFLNQQAQVGNFLAGSSTARLSTYLHDLVSNGISHH